MKRTVKLQTSERYRVRIVLENWGSGADGTMRRWTLGDGYWQCMDSGEIAEELGPGGPKVFGDRNSAFQSSGLVADGRRAQVKVPGMRGQTMVEYALIIAAVGAVAWGAYNITGHDIGSMASGIDSALTNT
jgi:Flp pilus assembly pilin Flp